MENFLLNIQDLKALFLKNWNNLKFKFLLVLLTLRLSVYVDETVSWLMVQNKDQLYKYVNHRL